MKNNEEFDINVYAKAYLFSEITDKLKITIRYNKVKNIIFLIEFCESNAVYTDSINLLHKHKYNIFEKTVHNNHHIIRVLDHERNNEGSMLNL